jgi:hypothetical protein
MGKDQTAEEFVRKTLGCACPDEVFKKIEYGEVNPAEGIRVQTITVGGRLLVYIWVVRDPALLETGFLSLVAAGKEERDRRGLNRIRVVLATGDLDSVRSAAEALFNGFEAKDEKVHLHIVPTEVVAGLT